MDQIIPNFDPHCTPLEWTKTDILHSKGQLILKANCQAVNSSTKRMNEFVITTMRRVFVRFLEEIEDTKRTFQNYLTFSKNDVEHF